MSFHPLTFNLPVMIDWVFYSESMLVCVDFLILSNNSYLLVCLIELHYVITLSVIIDMFRFRYNGLLFVFYLFPLFLFLSLFLLTLAYLNTFYYSVSFNLLWFWLYLSFISFSYIFLVVTKGSKKYTLLFAINDILLLQLECSNLSTI